MYRYRFIITVVGLFGVVVMAVAQTTGSFQIPNFGGGAQTNLPFQIPDISFTPVSIEIDPDEAPSPGETITITAKTPTFNKNSVQFNWTIDGKPRKDLSGIGKNNFTIIAKDVGSATNIRVTAQPLKGNQGSATATIRPADIILMWYAESYIPRWYKGKAIPTQGSTVRVIAMPNFIINKTFIPPANLVYIWNVDSQLNVLSGQGERVLTHKLSNLTSAIYEIEVIVEDIQQRIKKKARISIQPYNPVMNFFGVSPLGGVETRRTANRFLKYTNELNDFEIEPFFFNVKSKNELTYRWQIGNEQLTEEVERPSLITVNTRNSATGTVPLAVTIDDDNPSNPTLSKTLRLEIE